MTNLLQSFRQRLPDFPSPGVQKDASISGKATAATDAPKFARRVKDAPQIGEDVINDPNVQATLLAEHLAAKEEMTYHAHEGDVAHLVPQCMHLCHEHMHP
jgi:hypothetical protein